MKFYRIPVRPDRRHLWLKAIRRKNFNPSRHAVISSEHFVGGKCGMIVYTLINCIYCFRQEEQWERIACFSCLYIPKIFSFISSPRKREARQSVGRYHSAKRRALIKQKHHDAVEAQLAAQVAQEEEIEGNVMSGISISVLTDLSMQHIKQLEISNKISRQCIQTGWNNWAQTGTSYKRQWEWISISKATRRG